MKRVAVPVLTLLLLSLAHAQTLKPSSVFVKAVLGKDAVRVEEYYAFPRSLERNLVSLSEEIGPRYSLWKRYIEGLETHACRNPLHTHIILKKEEVPKLLLTYICRETKFLSEDLLFYSLEFHSFRFPLISGLMTLPEGYTLKVEVERGEVVEVNPEPTLWRSKEVIWEGPISTAQRFVVKYRIPKVYTVPSLTEGMLFALKDPLVGVSILFVLMVLFLLRNKIREVVHHLVSSTTDIVRE